MLVHILMQPMFHLDLYHMVSGLTYYLSMKYAPQLMQGMKLVYEDEFQRALQEDGSLPSTYITPKSLLPRSIMAKYATGK